MDDSSKPMPLPASLRPMLERADEAYAVWSNKSNDFFAEDDASNAEAEMRDELAQLFAASLSAGTDVDQLSAHLKRRLPEAADLIGEVLESARAEYAEDDSWLEEFSEQVTRVCPGCGSASLLDAGRCGECGRELPPLQASELLPMIQRLQGEIRALASLQTSRDLPDSKILSKDFLTRAFAVYGHTLVANLIIAVPLYFLFFVLLLAARI
jgi:hypothetical protein